MANSFFIFDPDNGDLKYSCIRNQHPVFSGSQEKRKKLCISVFLRFCGKYLKANCKVNASKSKRNCHVNRHLPVTEAIFMISSIRIRPIRASPLPDGRDG
ncbi:MAG: hypothetical protein M9926_10470 [Lentimicrobium sp.]|uniref:hypothetical protein n=1 Tax=Lentimicrobium sp. TaxID=2034841 RepID=UPI0025D50C1F|nr:hypothetical protein [Lentimicrobium sp.]MCO5257173.1 hypothetical protein [Lentimicrobium sp.]